MTAKDSLHPRQFPPPIVFDDDDDDYMEGDDPEKDWRRREAKLQFSISDEDDAYY